MKGLCWKRTIAVVLLMAFAGVSLVRAEERAFPAFQEKDGAPIKKKKFPWLLAALGFATAGTAVFLLMKKKKNDPTDEPKPKPDPANPSYDELVAQFDYNAQAPLDIVEAQVEQRNAASIHHLFYTGFPGGQDQVEALLVVPKKTGPFPAVLFLHAGQLDLYEFLDEAVDLAGRGVISLLVMIPGSLSSHTPYYPVRIVVGLRRSVDLLLARNDVAPGRIGYVGHSLGGTWGGTLAGVEKRLKCYVFMGGIAKETLFPLNFSPYHYVGHAAPAALLFQFALNDEYVSIQSANEYFQFASEPKSILWYDTTHAFNAQAQSDRINWLGSKLGFH